MATIIEDIIGDDPTPHTGRLSDLAQLRKDAESFVPKDLRYVHPLLPQYILVFRHDLDWDEMETWRKKCITKPARNNRPEENDPAKFGRLIIAGTNIGIEHRGDDLTALIGTPVLDSRGDPIRFANREFMGEFGVGTAADAVKEFIRSDPAIASLSNQIITDNGVGDEVEQLPDPTGGEPN